MRGTIFHVSLFLVLLASDGAVFGAQTWTVTSTADTETFGTLRFAIDSSQAGDTITFNLTYPATITLSNFDLFINHSLTVTGPGSSKLTIDSTNNHNDRVFTVKSGTVSISGLTVTGGGGKGSDSTINGEGGAIYNAATLTLNDVTLSNSKVSAMGVGGGGIFSSGTLALTGCTVTGNKAGGTSLALDQFNQPIVLRGGGIRNQNGSLTVSNSTISNNFADEGGGIWTNGTQFSVSGSTFYGNQAGVGVSTTLNLEGGGIYVKSSQADSSVINSTFVNNQGKIYGGAMTILPGGAFSVTVSDSTFSGNTAHGGSGAGGAFSVENGTLILKNNLLYDPSECYFGGGALTSLGYNLASDSSCGLASSGDLQSTVAGLDPASLQNNGGSTQTVAVLSTSPAVDAGSCTDAAGNTVSTDQRGVTRPQGTGCDIGAFELEQSSTTTVTNTNDSGAGSLRDAISNAPDGGTIDFNLTYPATIILTSGVLTIDKNLSIRGPGASNLAISGGSSSSCIIFPNGTKECTPPSGGSEIFDVISGVSASITGVTLENGNNDNGGALVNYGTLNLGDCVVTANQSIQGGALNNQGTGTLVLKNCNVSNNTASGIGGGLINFGTATVTGSTFSSNSAAEAAGIYNGATITITNSTFAGNQNNTAGATLENQSTMHVSNSTLFNNSSPVIAAGIYNINGTTTIKGALLAKGSLGNNCAVNTGTITSQGYNLSDDNSCTSDFTDPTDQNNTSAGLDLNGLQDNGGPTKTVALLGNSAAVDAIPTNSCTDVDGNTITLDQRGISRPQGNGCDVGAFELEQTATTTSVVSSLNPSIYGQSVTFTATVQSGSGTPSGSVTFYDGQNSLGTATLSSGQATLSTAALIGGQHTITAAFGGAGGFASSTSTPLAQTVNPAATSTTLISSPNPSTYGGSVAFTATVSSSVAGTLTGTVTFYDGTTSLGSMSLSSGQAVLAISTLTGGSHTITLTYSGDTNFATSTSAGLMQKVNRASTSTTIASSLSPSAYGQPVTFTATVSSTAGTPTGTVTFFDGLLNIIGSSTLISGQATVTVVYPALKVGSHNIYASYGGDTNFATSFSSALPLTVTKATTTISLTATPNPATTVQTVTLSADVQTQYGPPLYGGVVTGTVSFMEGTTKILGTGTLLNGIASLQLTLGQGSHTITAVYGGDSNNTGSTSAAVTETITAPQSTTTTISSSLNPSYVGQLVTFTAAVTPSQATGMVTFMQGQTTLGTVTLSAGKASFATSTLPAGNVLITAVYSGDGQYAGSTSSSLPQTVYKALTATSIVSFPNPSIIFQQVTFLAHVSVSSPSGGIPLTGGRVAFMKGSTIMGYGTLDSTGTAKFVTSFSSPGNYNVKAVYGGTSAYLASTSTTITQVVNF